MSHDRGCHCGRERWEYDDCPNHGCMRREGSLYADRQRSLRELQLRSIGMKREEMVNVPWCRECNNPDALCTCGDVTKTLDEELARAEPDLTKDSGDKFLDHIQPIANEDARGLMEAQKSYGNSWKERGGFSAFMNLDRKWARLVKQVQREPMYDLFAHIANDPRAEGIIDDIRDLRRYLLLVEAEMRARGFSATHRDNK